jgi:hypothetical protein
MKKEADPIISQKIALVVGEDLGIPQFLEELLR